MYIMITEVCNMECPHCCFSCGPTGDHMAEDIFRKALKLAEEYDPIVAIGGGEPTAHPDFWKFLGLALGSALDWIWLATNGKRTDDALRIARLARKGVIGAALSLDDYHEPIDVEVENAFRKTSNVSAYGSSEDDGRSIRDVSNHVLAVGRGVNIDGAEPGCPYEDIFIDVRGRIWACGCRKTQLGDVDDPRIPDYEEWEERFGVDRGECVEQKTKLLEVG